MHSWLEIIRRYQYREKVKWFFQFAFITLLSCLLTSCGAFDSGVVWRGGPYELYWIDISDRVCLGYDLGNGNSIGRIDECVFAVGWDGRYLVAKQHPKGDKKITNYFIIDAQKDSRYTDPKHVVLGPISEEEFKAKVSELNLPPFSKVLESLK